MTPTPADGGSLGACTASAADGIAIAETDVYGGAPFALGYPPYAIDGCRLAYVAAEAGGASGRLLLRDLSTLAETDLAAAAEEPRRPTVGGDVVAWEATVDGKRAVRVFADGKTVTVTGPFDHAGEPRATAGAVVLTGWLGAADDGDTDVFLYQTGTAEVVPIATGRGQQRFADVSSAYVAYTDFAEDFDGTFNDDGSDIADLGVFDRSSGESLTRARIGKQAFPLIADGGKLAYLDWGLVHPEPKFSAYELLIGEIGGSPDQDVVVDTVVTSQPYIRPTARASVLEWVQWPPGDSATLWRRPIDLAVVAKEVAGLEGLELFGPSASATATVLAGRTPGGAMSLRAVER